MKWPKVPEEPVDHQRSRIEQYHRDHVCVSEDAVKLGTFYVEEYDSAGSERRQAHPNVDLRQ